MPLLYLENHVFNSDAIIYQQTYLMLTRTFSPRLDPAVTKTTNKIEKNTFENHR